MTEMASQFCFEIASLKKSELNTIVVIGLAKKIIPETMGLVIFNPNKLQEKAANNTRLIEKIGAKF